MSPLAPGTIVGPYVVEALLAQGGMGAVYRARRRADGAVVALKLLLAGIAAGEAQRRRFQREGELAARLNHPSIVRVHDAGLAGPLPFIAMDLVDGSSLADLVGRVAPLEAARLLADVARGVAHAHAHGVLHRDLKPHNVLVRRDDGRALVTDFGVARALAEESSLTRTGGLVGTPTYLAPEQAAGGRATPESDVHALGAILHEALTGAPPFAGDDLPSLLVAIAGAAPARPGSLVAGVPPALDRVCLAALAKDPARRPTAGDLAAALDAIAAGRAPAGFEAPPRRARVPLLVVAAGGAGIAFASAWPAPGPVPAGNGQVAATPSTALVSTAAPSPAWQEPAWLQALIRQNGDLPSLTAAFDAVEGVEHDPRTVARAIELLAAFEASWREPGKLGWERREALNRLLFIQAIWSWLDPTHRCSAAVDEVFVDNGGWALSVVDGTVSWEGKAWQRLARAHVRVLSDDLNSYLMYADATRGEMGPVVTSIYRRGLEVAVERDSPRAWALILVEHTNHLRDQATAGSKEALDELLALAASTPAHADRGLDEVTHVLKLAARHDPSALRALEHLDRALALNGDTADLLVSRGLARKRLLSETGDPAHRVAALADLERALALVERRPTKERWSPSTIGRALHELLEPAPAAAALERVLRLASQRALAGVALRRTLSLAEAGAGAELGAALADVRARLDRLPAGREIDPDTRAHTDQVRLAVTSTATALARGELTPPQVAERLRALCTERALDLLDDR